MIILRILLLLMLGVTIFFGIYSFSSDMNFYIQAFFYGLGLTIYSFITNILRSYVISYPDPSQYFEIND